VLKKSSRSLMMFTNHGFDSSGVKMFMKSDD